MESGSDGRVETTLMSTISHKLRTPLNSILGFSELLLDQAYGPLNEKQVRYLNNIHKSGSNLLSLLNDLIDFMRIKWGEVNVEYGEFSLSKSVDEAQMAFKTIADRKGITLEVTNADARVTVKADEVKLVKILHQLVSNAIKFTAPGGKVTITVNHTENPQDHYVTACSRGFLEISVADTGIGIRPEDYEKIFSEFYQGDAMLSQELEGTGLGLTVARELVVLHGGKIWVESHEGKGSTFTFTLNSGVQEWV